MTVVEVVGASPIGHASRTGGSTSATSEACSRVDSALLAMPISGMRKRLA